MNIFDVLKSPMSAEEYLGYKRAELREKLDERAENMRNITDEARKKLIASADRCALGGVILPGTGGKPLYIGVPPKWLEQPVPDNEFHWQLNRLGNIATLSRAYLASGDGKYAKTAIEFFRDWLATCPPPPHSGKSTDAKYARENFNSKNPWRVLEVGIRAFDTIPAIYRDLLLSEYMTPELHREIVESLYTHAEILATVAPICWPRADHNHYLHCVLGLIVVSTLFPELKEAEEWLKFAISELIRCFDAQITPEGAQVEGSPGYHVICLGMFIQALELMAENGHTPPPELFEKVESAIEYASMSVTPTSHFAALGDTRLAGVDGLCGIIERYRRVKGNLGGFARLGSLLDLGAKYESEPILSHYPGVGQAIGRTGFDKSDSYFAFICKSPVYNTHAHIDPLSFVLTLRGEDVVIDPSYFTYHGDDNRRRYKSATYHSCVVAYEREPFEYRGSWSYGPQAEGKTVGAYSEEGLLGADAVHYNYSPLVHKRAVALVGKDTFVVIDDIYNPELAPLTMYYHMNDPECRLAPDGRVECKGASVTLPADAELLPSMKSPHTDEEIPSVRIRCDLPISERGLYLTLVSTVEIKDALVTPTEEGAIVELNEEGVKKSLVWSFGKGLTLR